MKTNSDNTSVLSHETLELLAMALNCSASPFALYDKDFALLYANDITRKAWPGLIGALDKGLHIDEAIRAETENLHKSPTDQQFADTHKYVHAALRNPKTTNMPSFDGRYFKMSHHKIGDVATAGIGIDVTQAMEDARALEKARTLQKQTIEALPQCLLVVDKEGYIVQFNKAYADYVASTGGQVHIGMSMKDRVRASMNVSLNPVSEDEFDNWYDNEFRARFNLEGEPYEEEYSLARGDHLLWRQHYIPVVGNLITITNITAIKNAQIAAKESERARTEFLANMSHEIRTPMNGVLGMAQLLANCDLGPKEQNFVKTIQRSGEALVTIINDILDFSKIDSGHISLSKGSFCLHETIEDIALLLSASANEKGVDLFVNIQPDLSHRFVGDEGRLRQVLMNLIGNAVKFTNKGYVMVRVGGETHDDLTELKISVIDTGIGIPAEQLVTVFKKFQQVDSTRSRKYEGTGLGLSIAKQLVELMGGDIAVNSHVGQGSEFEVQITLPHCEASHSRYYGDEELDGRNLLIVTPNSHKQDALKNQLQYHGAKAISVAEISKAITVLKAAYSQNLILDAVIVSGKTCLENIEPLVQYCKSSRHPKHIAVVTLSSVGQDKILQKLKSKTIDAYLTYPLQNKHLLEGIVGALDTSTAVVSPLFKQSHKEYNIAQGNTHHNTGIFANSPALSEKVFKSKTFSREVCDILVAEDNEVNQMYIDYLLESTHYRHRIAGNGEEAFELFKQYRPKLILMDISMPKMNGFDATHLIRQYEAEANLSRTPIIALTAHAMSDDKKKCLASGMDDYMSKPLPKERLLQTLETWLEKGPEDTALKRVM